MIPHFTQSNWNQCFRAHIIDCKCIILINGLFVCACICVRIYFNHDYFWTVYSLLLKLICLCNNNSNNNNRRYLFYWTGRICSDEMFSLVSWYVRPALDCSSSSSSWSRSLSCCQCFSLYYFCDVGVIYFCFAFIYTQTAQPSLANAIHFIIKVDTHRRRK